LDVTGDPQVPNAMYVTPPPTPPPPAGITTGTILAAARITGSCTDLSTQRTAPSDAVLVIEDFSESELSGSTKPRCIGRYTPGFRPANERRPLRTRPCTSPRHNGSPPTALPTGPY